MRLIRSSSWSFLLILLLATGLVHVGHIFEEWYVLQTELSFPISKRIDDFLFRFGNHTEAVLEGKMGQYWAAIMLAGLASSVPALAIDFPRKKRLIWSVVAFGVTQSCLDYIHQSADSNLLVSISLNLAGGVVLGLLCVACADLIEGPKFVRRSITAASQILRYAFLLSIPALLWWILFGMRLSNAASVNIASFSAMRAKEYNNPTLPTTILKLKSGGFFADTDGPLSVQISGAGNTSKAKVISTNFPVPKIDPVWIDEAKNTAELTASSGQWVELGSQSIIAKNEGASVVGLFSGESAFATFISPTDGLEFIVEEPPQTSRTNAPINLSFVFSNRASLRISDTQSGQLFFQEKPRAYGRIKAQTRDSVRFEKLGDVKPVGVHFMLVPRNPEKSELGHPIDDCLLSLSDLTGKTVTLTADYKEIFFGNARTQYEALLPIESPVTAKEIYVSVKEGSIRSGHKTVITLQKHDELRVRSDAPISLHRTGSGSLLISGDLTYLSVNGEFVDNTIWGEISDGTKQTTLALLLGVLITSFKRVKNAIKTRLKMIKNNLAKLTQWLDEIAPSRR